MSESNILVELLRAVLQDVPKPDRYEEIKSRLIASRPRREVPTINESPENTRQPMSTIQGARGVSEAAASQPNAIIAATRGQPAGHVESAGIVEVGLPESMLIEGGGPMIWK